MTTLREAAQQALEALEDHATQYPHMQKGYTVDAITALRAALAQEEQEPVAWMVYTLDGKSVCVTDNPADFNDQHRALPLYTHSPQRNPLTEEEIDSLFGVVADAPRAHWLREAAVEIVRKTERAHGIGGQDE